MENTDTLIKRILKLQRELEAQFKKVEQKLDAVKQGLDNAIH